MLGIVVSSVFVLFNLFNFFDVLLFRFIDEEIKIENLSKLF